MVDEFRLPAYTVGIGAKGCVTFSTEKVVITSLNFASKMRADIRAVPFDLCVIDEAHKLRNAYRPSSKMGQNIKWAVEERRKLLLTATPLQNSLLELRGE